MFRLMWVERDWGSCFGFWGWICVGSSPVVQSYCLFKRFGTLYVERIIAIVWEVVLFSLVFFSCEFIRE